MSGGLTPVGMQTFDTIELPLQSGDLFAVQRGTEPLASITFPNLSAQVFEAQSSGITPGTYTKVQVNAFGVVTFGSLLNSSDVVSALGYTPVNPSEIGQPNGLATLDGNGYLTAAQIPPSLLSGLSPLGTWNAATNTPTLQSSIPPPSPPGPPGGSGAFYVVSVAGTTNLNGISTWGVGDWALFSNGVWERVPSAVVLGTMATQNANAVAITGGTIGASVTLGALSLNAALVTANEANAVARATAQIQGEEIHLMDLLGGQHPDGQACATAFLHCLALATARPGSTIFLPTGTVDLSGLSAATGAMAAIIPQQTRVKGSGINETIVIWNDNGGFNLFGSAGARQPNVNNYVTDITLEDFTVRGSWATNGPAVTGGYPIQMTGVAGLRIRRMCVEFSRIMSIVGRACYDVQVNDCVVRYGARDGINMQTCSLVIITGNTVRYVDDNAISVSSENVDDALTVRRNIIVDNNCIFCTSGILAQGPRIASISNNVIEFSIQQAIGCNSKASGNGSIASEACVIANNIISTVINRFYIDGLSNGCNGIALGDSAARAGGAPAIPGENVVSTGAIVPYEAYFQSNSSSSAVATGGGRSYIVTGNVIATTIPACDGTVTATGGTGTTYRSWTDLGFGDPVAQNRFINRAGWINPVLPQVAYRMVGINFSGAGVIRNAEISNNIIRGVLNGIGLNNSGIMGDIRIRGNQIADCNGADVAGIAIVPGSLTLGRIFIEDNLLDIDPKLIAPGRGTPPGTWQYAATCFGILIQTGGTALSVIMRRNTARNCYSATSINTPAQTEAADNFVECNPANDPTGSLNGWSPLNYGIGNPGGLASGWTVRQVDGNPESSTYGQVLDSTVNIALTVPTAGYYESGARVWSQVAGPDAHGNLLLGWSRLTTGSSNVLGTDWMPLFVNVGALDPTASPTTGASNGQVSAITLQGPGVFEFYNDGTLAWPTATLSAAPAGGTTATVNVAKMAPLGLAGPTNTITPASIIQIIGASAVPVIVNPGTAIQVGDNLVAQGWTGSTPLTLSVDSVDLNGGVTGCHIAQNGTASAYPPEPCSFASTHGSNFQANIPIWAVLANGGVAVTGPGNYKNAPAPTLTWTPNTAPGQQQSSGEVTVQMGQSFFADYTGIHYGTFNAGSLTPTGYITITDINGTQRRLLVG